MARRCFPSVEKFDPREAAVYMAALIDGEGCVSLCTLKIGPSAGSVRRVVTIGMTDEALIDLAAELYTQLGITFSRHDKAMPAPRKHVWTIAVQARASLERLAEVVPIRHPEKRAKLQAVLDSFPDRVCKPCGAPLDQRSRGCSACRDRHKMRRRAGTPSACGETGRPRADAPRVYG